MTQSNNFSEKERTITDFLYISAALSYFSIFSFPLIIIVDQYIRRCYFQKCKPLLISGVAHLVAGSAVGLYIICIENTLNATTVIYISIIIMLIPSFGSGIYNIYLYFEHSKQIDRFNKLEVLIETHHITSIEKICEINGKSYSSNVKYLKKMINYGRLEDAKLDFENKSVFVIRKWSKLPINCDSCGGDFEIDDGADLTCPYCGSPAGTGKLGDITHGKTGETVYGKVGAFIKKHTKAFICVGILFIVASIVLFLAFLSIKIGIPLFFLFLFGILMIFAGVIYESL